MRSWGLFEDLGLIFVLKRDNFYGDKSTLGNGHFYFWVPKRKMIVHKSK